MDVTYLKENPSNLKVLRNVYGFRDWIHIALARGKKKEKRKLWKKGRQKTYQVPIPPKVQFKLYMICLFMEWRYVLSQESKLWESKALQ
jgi:hypothetical protein